MGWRRRTGLGAWVLAAGAIGALAAWIPFMQACATMQASDAASDSGFDARLADKSTLVVFMTAWCEVCRHETPALTAWARAHQGGANPASVLVVISGSPAADVPRLAREHHLDPALLPVVADPDGTIADRFGITATPTMIHFAGSATRPSPPFHSVAALPEPPALAASPSLPTPTPSL